MTHLPYDVPVNWFDATAAPGWHDWVGLVLAGIGFWIAMCQIREAKRQAKAAATETRKATTALKQAQRQLSTRAVLMLGQQFSVVSSDLQYALPEHDAQVASRALLRFAHLARESVGIIDGLDDQYASLVDRLGEAAEEATAVKGKIMSTAQPNVVKLAKTIAADIDKLGAEITGLSSGIRHTIDGGSDV